jgi:predicted transposase/invertase (TIGR01784 family)
MTLTPLNNSVVFRKLFREPDVLSAFIKDLTGVNLALRPEQIEFEKKFQPTIGSVDIEMDIFVDDPTHRLVIEMQKIRYDYHYDRFLYYHNAAMLDLQRSYRSYRLERTVYTIVWLTARSHQPAFQHGLITTSYCSITPDGSVLEIYPHKLFFLNPAYLDPTIPPDVADWLILAAESIRNPQHPNINRQRAIIARASSLIADEDLTPQERARIMDENDFDSKLRTERETGHKEGFAEGENVGRLAEKREMVRAMLAKGMDIALVAEVTGLSPDEVASLGRNSEV